MLRQEEQLDREMGFCLKLLEGDDANIGETIAAPELAALRKPLSSFKADVYAFGVILLEILTGRCAGDVITGDQEGVDLTDWVDYVLLKEGVGSALTRC
ncbi:unnamed protein product [Eruca vesicaria subsp. sativa]|uniref:Protein kinase domain-containing protein n=1 Tax=Eruca vesicaria subsp. sativa TaxID=29727 RepID=A0ABC8LW34_ERUVS|nr:unnamed protein product [Eruca vesicaria subsp. sativa]